MITDVHWIEFAGERVEEAELLEAYAATTLTDARARIGQLADEVRIAGRPTLLTRHGRPAVALVSAEDAMRLLALRRVQERRGIDAARLARATRAPGTPIDDLLAAAGASPVAAGAAGAATAVHDVALQLAADGLVEAADLPEVEERLHDFFDRAAAASADEGVEQEAVSRDAGEAI